MFAEAVAVSWWVDALRGQTLRNLHYRWEVGQSVFTMFHRMRFWGWICLGSLAFTTYTGLEALLQTASSSTTILSRYPANMTGALANALPDGFSGVIAAIGHDSFGTVYFTPSFIEILQNYTSQSPIYLHLEGCGSTSNVSCATTLNGVGFQYNCNASRSELQTPLSDSSNGTVSQPYNAVFEVDVGGGRDWSISLDILWQDRKGYDGLVVANRHCTIVPALVEYPVNVTQRIATLQPPTAGVNWTAGFEEVDPNALRVDKVLKLLSMPEYDKDVENNAFPNPGVHSTLGGVSLAFSSLFNSKITVKSDVTNQGADVSVQGSFAAPYAQFAAGTGNVDKALNNTYPSPMDALLTNIRDIMFRSSVAVAEHRVADYVWTDSEQAFDVPSSHIPTQNVTNLGEYRVYHTVYKTDNLILSICIGLMAVALLAILPLYWGFWRLGRKVSMSPLEVAKALQHSTITDTRAGMAKPESVLDFRRHPDQLPGFGSNIEASELVKLLGNKRVKYGEVSPSVLGIGLSEGTATARKGWRYH